MIHTKPINPKEVVGAGKVPTWLVSLVAVKHEALALLSGLLKYGRTNWRAVDVKSTVYARAAMDHIQRWMEGEDLDPETRLHNLGHARACLSILLDAEATGTLVNDRNFNGRGVLATVRQLDDGEVQRLTALYADRSPVKHYTMADNHHHP